MRVIPAIDIIDGKCVRLSQGDYDQKKIYNENPLDVAKSFEDHGLQYLHLVDLDGAKNGAVTNWKVIERICKETKLHVDFGGGIKTEAEVLQLLNLGVKQVNLGSIAVKNPKLVEAWIKAFGSSKIILSADVKEEVVQISGWLEKSSMTIFELLDQYKAYGIQFVTCTDIATDGMLQGPNLSLYNNLTTAYPDLNFIASGGVSSLDDLRLLREAGAEAAIVGKAIYEGKFSLTELAQEMKALSTPVVKN
jgi:phosphoribosylformimino-5-aminoimidazole carboxamide ribotide isomerase